MHFLWHQLLLCIFFSQAQLASLSAILRLDSCAHRQWHFYSLSRAVATIYSSVDAIVQQIIIIIIAIVVIVIVIIIIIRVSAKVHSESFKATKNAFPAKLKCNHRRINFVH
jgi:heme/copper-type cytochrome/quinol oxidase subunit 2